MPITFSAAFWAEEERRRIFLVLRATFLPLIALKALSSPAFLCELEALSETGSGEKGASRPERSTGAAFLLPF